MAFTEPTEDIVEAGDNLLPFTAEEDVLRGQVVKVDGSIAVEPSDADGETVHGVAVQSVSSGDNVTVACTGVEVEMTAGTSGISAGDALASHGATGEEGQVDTAATGDYIVGYALESSSSQGDLVRAMVDLGGQVN